MGERDERKRTSADASKATSGFRTELESLIGDVKRKGASGNNREAESIDAPIRVGLLHSSSPPALPTHRE
jgi:hypothetical protein